MSAVWVSTFSFHFCIYVSHIHPSRKIANLLTHSKKLKKMSATMILQLIMWLITHHHLWIMTAAAAALSDEQYCLPDCSPCKCGNITIPYPFGIRDGCYRPENDQFQIKCNSSTSPPTAFFGKNVQVIEASLEHVVANTWISYACHDRVNIEYNRKTINFTLGTSPFTFSASRNRFTVLGCAIKADLHVFQPEEFISGCTSVCDRMSIGSSPCPGIGCCQTGIPEGLKAINISSKNLSDYNDYANCGYAFLADERYQFNETLVLSDANFQTKGQYRVPAVLDWVAGNETCEQAQTNASSYACRDPNSICVESENGPGYKCQCADGYRGNPYLLQGCRDVNECMEKNHTCPGICNNVIGNYTCSCLPHQHDRNGDGRSCIDKTTPFPVFKTVLVVGLAFLALLVIGSWLYWGMKQRRLMKLREHFFKQNGGLLLQQQISLRQGATETSKIFSAKELEKATNNYSESQILGKGGYGTVYRGILWDNRTVAIKKSKIIDENQIEQFINEVFILSQVNHRNVVKLLGCCLETEVPLLVYEYVPNGTLSHHIHDEGHASSLSLGSRLRIATETASALAYLHFESSIPIFHRDVKSTNILLDNNYTAKVSDFGASRLVPMDKNQLTTLVQGTLGYLDPEYMITSQLTEKSDVYSFGVVLAELLTGMKPLSFERAEEDRNLSKLFISSMKENRLFDILETKIINEGNVEQVLAIAEVAKRCLKMKGNDRPTMKQVAAELEGLRRFTQHPWSVQSKEEMESLLSYEGDACAEESTSAGYHSLSNYTTLDIEMPR